MLRLLLAEWAGEAAVVAGMESHAAARTAQPAVAALLRYCAALARKRLGLAWVTDTELARLYGVLRTNGVGRTNPDGSRAVYLYPTVALMSHSCQPNLELVDRQTVFVLYSA